MKKPRITVIVAMLAAAAFALPRAENVSFIQNGATVMVTYSLTETPAIVTFDILRRADALDVPVFRLDRTRAREHCAPFRRHGEVNW